MSVKESVSGLDPSIISAIIGSATAMITFVIKDLIIGYFSKRKARNEEIEKMYKKYSIPIIQAVDTLSWRIVEILDKRSQFLLMENQKNEFYKYKFISTLYRLAKVIGWFQAIENEYTYLDTGNANKNEEVRKAIKNFRNTLSDGTHIEDMILKELLDLFQIKVSQIPQKLAVEIENIIINYSENGRKCNIKKLNSEDKFRLITEVICHITNKLNICQIDAGIINENLEKSIRIMARRETWIYRDWQDDIGNKMLNLSKSSNRKYEIMNFGEFEELYNLKEKPVWINRLSELFENLNIDKKDFYDARVVQMNDILKSSIDVYKVFWKLNKIKSSINDQSIEQLEEKSKKHKSGSRRHLTSSPHTTLQAGPHRAVHSLEQTKR